MIAGMDRGQASTVPARTSAGEPQPPITGTRADLEDLRAPCGGGGADEADPAKRP